MPNRLQVLLSPSEYSSSRPLRGISMHRKQGILFDLPFDAREQRQIQMGEASHASRSSLDFSKA